MKLYIYKGFSTEFLNEIKCTPLVNSDVFSKIDVLSFTRKTRKDLERALIDLQDDDVVWITYEEYSLIKSRVDDAIVQDDLEVVVIRNNIYPEYYPLEFNISDDLAREILEKLDGDQSLDSQECRQFLSIYNSLILVEDKYYASFFNYEFDKNDGISSKNYYPAGVLDSAVGIVDYQVYLNDDIATYLSAFQKIDTIKPKRLGVQTTVGETSNRFLNALLSYCLLNNIEAYSYYQRLSKDDEFDDELIRIVRDDIGLKQFSEFRKLLFYKHPDIDKQVLEISQGQIIKEIINQAENCYQNSIGGFRDIFITAPTGAGKSLMFQIPAVYLAKKYNKLTIIIEPVKALMQDQKEKLNKNGYFRVETFNSDLITQVEKESVLNKIKNGNVDLLYLSPETLLSYSIESIIGDREIGLLIVDEAHIVTTWGIGFRPDYWYLGGYINKLRHQIQAHTSSKRKIYRFPICAFTATAINGGLDDSVGETIISLSMENPIKYIGFTKRTDIRFQINNKSTSKLITTEYEARKTSDLSARLEQWIAKKEKTIVYFPYASLARDAKYGFKSFAGIYTDDSIGIYTGRNIEEQSQEYFNAHKREVFENFRNGVAPVMYATKAFGMGVDINDIKNVYHYATTGNLCDYVQEIGRVAREKSMVGYAITDFYENDFKFMKVLFGMSQIKQYQIKKVLEGVYETFVNKKEVRNFLISPESFAYIFGAKDTSSTNQLKTCLLMLEKDFYDKYNYKVLISRPQGVFTKAYVVIDSEKTGKVLGSKFSDCFTLIQKGRSRELQDNGAFLSDKGDIYSLDLKRVWEEYYPNISFPQFKYWYFNPQAAAYKNAEIMSEIRDYIYPRQRVVIDATKDYMLCDIRNMILDDFEYVSDVLYQNFRNKFFTIDDFVKTIKERYGIDKSRVIANALFDLVDPNGKCVKRRANDASSHTQYYLAHGNFKEYMRKAITAANLISKLNNIQDTNYSAYIGLSNDEWSSLALKLLSVFGYITYEVSGGEEPEIFIRLNDPNKIRRIVANNMPYSNAYVTKARNKHDRDIRVLSKFFTELITDEERWNYIENYFLGRDVLSYPQDSVEKTEMRFLVDKDRSHSINATTKWSDILSFFDKTDCYYLKGLIESGVAKPEYLKTTIKHSPLGEYILMSWPRKNTLICAIGTPESVLRSYATMGWNAYEVAEIDYEKLLSDIK